MKKDKIAGLRILVLRDDKLLYHSLFVRISINFGINKSALINSLKSLFTFSKKELNGLMVFCVLLAGIMFTPAIYRLVYQPEVFAFDDFKKEIEAFEASERVRPAFSYASLKEEVEEKEAGPLYFEFNPNNLSAGEWRRLGLSKKQISVIKNYEAKGGRFYRKEDLKKIYSISGTEYARLAPYMIIPERFPKENKPAGFTKPVENVRNSKIAVEINAADSTQLETVRGIGPAFASRIIKYRKRLGGFYRKEQLREVYGIDSLKYVQMEGQITVDPAGLEKIAINNATFDDLKRHPYLSFKQMNAIIQYRKQHGAYHSIDDLRSVVLLNEDVLTKIKPYLNFND